MLDKRCFYFHSSLNKTDIYVGFFGWRMKNEEFISKIKAIISQLSFYFHGTDCRQDLTAHM